jgi:hypothetical protein
MLLVNGQETNIFPIGESNLCSVLVCQTEEQQNNKIESYNEWEEVQSIANRYKALLTNSTETVVERGALKLYGKL